MGSFTKAVDKSKTNVKKSKKETVWVISDSSVSASISQLRKISADISTLEARKMTHASAITDVAKELHVRTFCKHGVQPEGMVLQTEDGNRVGFVVQDRSGQYPISDDAIEMLRQLLGDATDDLLQTDTKISLDAELMKIPGVLEAIEKAVDSAIRKLVNSGVITEEQANTIVSAEQKTTFRRGTLGRSADICDRDPAKLSRFLEIMGSSCTRYAKP